MVHLAVQTVCVVGAGIMGARLAQVCIESGLNAILVDRDAELLDAGVSAIRSRVKREVDRGRMTAEDAEAALSRLRSDESADAASEADLVIEAITESLEPKVALFKRLGEVTSARTILASNTSSLSISDLAAASGVPERVIGLHFFNPPTVLKLVELVSTSVTTPTVVEDAREFCDKIGRITIQCGDTPGFVANRLLVPFILDAIRLVETGVASAEEVDQACMSGLSHTMGPLSTADLVGLDTLCSIAEVMFDEFGEPRFKPPVILQRMVALGHLGRKSGRGFFDHASEKVTPR